MNRKVVIIREFLLVFWKFNTSKKIIEFVIFGVQMMLIFFIKKVPYRYNDYEINFMQPYSLKAFQ
jgi:hypothetical protein